MANCIHQVVCKHYGADEIMECSCKDICKHFDKAYDDEPAMPSVRSSKKKDGLSDIKIKKDDGKETLKRFKASKVYLALHSDQLDENQKAAVSAVQGKHYTSLSEQQRQQIIDIAEDIKNK